MSLIGKALGQLVGIPIKPVIIFQAKFIFTPHVSHIILTFKTSQSESLRNLCRASSFEWTAHTSS